MSLLSTPLTLRMVVEDETVFHSAPRRIRNWLKAQALDEPLTASQCMYLANHITWDTLARKYLPPELWKDFAVHHNALTHAAEREADAALERAATRWRVEQEALAKRQDREHRQLDRDIDRLWEVAEHEMASTFVILSSGVYR